MLILINFSILPNKTGHCIQNKKEQLITEGVIKWHCHEVCKDIAVLTDINTTTGHIVPNSFVHVACVKDLSGEYIIMFKWMGRLLHMLSGNAALSSVLPFAGYDHFVTASTGNYDENLLIQLKEYNYEIAQLLLLSERDNSRTVVTDFLEYMLEKLDAIHSVNRKPPPPVQETPGTYKSPSGVAYYFSPTGEQVRKMPEYQVGASGKLNYDGIPVVHDPCTKYYPRVSTVGFGNMFLWFCPIHGHWYGFHLIAGGREEGTHFHLFSSTRTQCPWNYFMLLHASHLSMH